jgi:hypothetical protein
MNGPVVSGLVVIGIAGLVMLLEMLMSNGDLHGVAKVISFSKFALLALGIVFLIVGLFTP